MEARDNKWLWENLVFLTIIVELINSLILTASFGSKTRSKPTSMPWSGIKTKRTFYEEKEVSYWDSLVYKNKIIDDAEDAVLRNAETFIKNSYFYKRRGRPAAAGSIKCSTPQRRRRCQICTGRWPRGYKNHLAAAALTFPSGGVIAISQRRRRSLHRCWEYPHPFIKVKKN